MNEFLVQPANPADLMDTPLGVILAEAMERWQILTGLRADQSTFRFGDLNVRSMNEVMQQMLELEPQGTTTLMLLEIFLRDFLEGKSFTAAAIMKDYAAITDFLRRAEELFSIVQSDRAAAEMGQFRARTIAGLEHYRADRPDVIAMVNDNTILPFLRRDALKSLHGLTPHQFLGGADGEGQARVIEHVYISWDINDLLKGLRDMPVNGIAVVLLRDPANPDRSYFTFAMRNGANVILFTDRTKPVYPGQEDVLAGRGGRGIARAFANRSWANHFPYQLIPTSVDDEGDLHFDRETAPVLAGQTLAPLMRIADLPPHQAIWLTMMLSLINDRFWKQGWRAPELSYTAAMIREKSLLTVDSTGALLPAASGYRAVELDEVTLDEVSAGAMAKQTGRPPINAWLEERYRDKVPHEILNLWRSTPGEALLLPADTDELPHFDQRKQAELMKSARHLPAGVLAVQEGKGSSSWDRIPGHPLQTYSPTEFGTEEELRDDRIFIARSNMAAFIQREANREFKARKDEIAAWYYAALTRNKEGLIDLLARHLAGLPAFEARKNTIRTLHFHPVKSQEWQYYHNFGNVLGEAKYGTYERCCLLTDASSTAFRASFAPRDAGDLARMTGLKVEDLPDVLRNWCWEKAYHGNHLLNRIDPMESKVNDPWMKLPLGANFYLSKRGKAMIDKRATELAEGN